jgi:hypothetical protein
MPLFAFAFSFYDLDVISERIKQALYSVNAQPSLTIRKIVDAPMIDLRNAGKAAELDAAVADNLFGSLR